MLEQIRKHFFAGLIVLIPFLVLLWLAKICLGMVWNMLGNLPRAWQPEGGSVLAVDIIASVSILILLIMGISFLGWVSKMYLGQRLLKFLKSLIQRVPIFGTIYAAIDQLFKTFGSTDPEQQFDRVVYVEYPRKGIYTIGFVTSPTRGKKAPAGHLNVFVPTVPNPTSGFFLIVPEGETKETAMSVEEAFRTILSLGIAQPEEVPKA